MKSLLKNCFSLSYLEFSDMKSEKHSTLSTVLNILLDYKKVLYRDVNNDF